MDNEPLHCVIGPTASGKSRKAVELAKELQGEVISVDSRQVYRMLDIGTEKISKEEMGGVPHHLIDICDPRDSYSAGKFVADATHLIEDIRGRGNTPILAGGSHFYFEALVYGLPDTPPIDHDLRTSLEERSEASLYEELLQKDPRRAGRIDRFNKRRLVRALEIVHAHGEVPERERVARLPVSWMVVDTPRDELRERIHTRLEQAFERGLIDEVVAVRDYVGDDRLNELGLEYKVVGEYLRGERLKDTLIPHLSSRLWHYARNQKNWIKRLTTYNHTALPQEH